MLTSKNTTFNGSLFVNSEAATRFVGVETSPGVIPNLDSESQLALYTKGGKVLTVNFIDCLKKLDFLQTTSKIGN